jgi:hypothetical protein
VRLRVEGTSSLGASGRCDRSTRSGNCAHCALNEETSTTQWRAQIDSEEVSSESEH